MTEQIPDQTQGSEHSTDLVPLSYGRQAWNTIRNTNLETHTDRITAEQAATINAENEIVLTVGEHGLSKKYAQDPNEIPTQREYRTIGHVVERMRIGDVLFIENFGFSHQKPVPVENPLHPEHNAKPKSMVARVLGKLTLGASKASAHESAELKNSRMNNEVDVWGYAELYATQKGITVVSADIDAYVEDMITQGGDIFDIARNDDENNIAYMDRIRVLRNCAARNIVKDWLLSHPAPQHQDGTKRKAVVLFGANHTAGLEQAFAELNIQTRTYELPRPLPYAREREQRDPQYKVQQG